MTRHFPFLLTLGLPALFWLASACDGEPDLSSPQRGFGGGSAGADDEPAVTGGSTAGGAAGASACPEEYQLCEGECALTQFDPQNCGACGQSCDAGEICILGSCEDRCGTGLIACDQKCIDPQIHPEYCGATDCSTSASAGASGWGEECAADSACVQGACTTFSHGWLPAEQINDGQNPQTASGEVALGTDASGNALALWREYLVEGDDSTLRLYGRHFNAQSQVWGGQLRIDQADERVKNPTLAVNQDGDGLAIWVGVSATGSNLRAARYSPTSATWSAPILLAGEIAGGSSIDTPSVSLDALGNAWLSWTQDVADSGGTGLVKKVHVASWATGMSLPEPADVLRNFGEGDSPLWYPKVVSNDAGQAALTFFRRLSGATDGEIYVARRAASGDAWLTPELVSLPNNYIPEASDLAITSTGELAVVWTGWDSPANAYQIYLRRFSGGVWQDAAAIDVETTRGARAPKIAVDGEDVATIVYAACVNGCFGSSNLAQRALSATRVDASGSLIHHVLAPQVTPTHAGDFMALRVASDAGRDTFTLWRQGAEIRSARFDSEIGTQGAWIGPEVLNQASGGGAALSGSAVTPALSVSSSGRAHALWYQLPTQPPASTEKNSTYHARFE